MRGQGVIQHERKVTVLKGGGSEDEDRGKGAFA